MLRLEHIPMIFIFTDKELQGIVLKPGKISVTDSVEKNSNRINDEIKKIRESIIQIRRIYNTIKNEEGEQNIGDLFPSNLMHYIDRTLVKYMILESAESYATKGISSLKVGIKINIEKMEDKIKSHIDTADFLYEISKKKANEILNEGFTFFNEDYQFNKQKEAKNE